MSGPTPVGCRTNIRHCSASDQQLHNGLNAMRKQAGQDGVGKHVTPNGRTQSAQMKARAGAGSAATLLRRFVAAAPKMVVAELGHRAVDHLVKKVSHSAAGVLGAASHAHEVRKVQKEIVLAAQQDGREIAEAHDRDAMNLVVLEAIAGELGGYAGREIYERSGARGKADGLAAYLASRSAQGFEQLKDSWRRDAREGRELATQLNLKSREHLEELMTSHPTLAARFESHTAFRHGMLSVVVVEERRANASV